jgi:hypothetical protein
MSFSPLSVQSWQDRLLRRLGGIGALCALVVLVLGLAWGMFAPDEPTSELFILTTPIVTPLLLIPTVGAVYTIYRPTGPRLSLVMLSIAGVGIAGIAPLPILDLFDIPTNPIRGHPLLVLCLGLILANRLWPILAGSLELTQPRPPFAGMGIEAILAGGLFTLFVLCIMTFSWRSLETGYLLFFLLPLLVITQCVWRGRMSYRLLIDP